MDNLNHQILDVDFVDKPTLRRRELLPWWMKFFCWLFMIFGAFVPTSFIIGIFMDSYPISIYGLSAPHPFTILGVLLIAVFTFKGITAYGLWFEKDWAIRFGRIDAIIGIILCVVAIILPFIIGTNNLNIRLDIIFLFMYYFKLVKIEADWIFRK